MLALDSNAQVSSSAGVNPGLPAFAAAGIGQLDLAPYISQRAVFDWVYENWLTTQYEYYKVTADTLADLAAYTDQKLLDLIIATGYVRPDPDDLTRFQILRKLHIMYPADLNDATKVQGGGRLPLVLLVHGQHKCVEHGEHIPNHQGYVYLQRELASHGIVSVGVDTNAANAIESHIEMRAEIMLGALDAMRAMDADSTSPFYKRLDFNRVGLMGHSRGGDAVVRAAILNALRPSATRHRIRAVCSLAPTDFTGAILPGPPVGLKPNHTDFYLVVYGALDGDVSGYGGALCAGGTGFRHYDRAATDKAMVFLDKCGHNRFNTYWTNDEGGLLVTDINNRLADATTHRLLVNEYIGGLFRWRLLGKQAPKSLFDGTAANSLGVGFSLQWSFGKEVVVLDDFEKATPNEGQRDNRPGTVEKMPEVIADGTAVGKRTNHVTGVLVIAPHSTAEAYRLILPAARRDWSKYDQLIFRASSDADVSPGADLASALPDFKLVFTDTANVSEEVQVTSWLPAGNPTPGNELRPPVDHQTGSGNCTAVRLQTLSFNLSKLTQVNRKQMASVAVVPADIGRTQFFDSFQLVKR